MATDTFHDLRFIGVEVILILLFGVQFSALIVWMSTNSEYTSSDPLVLFTMKMALFFWGGVSGFGAYQWVTETGMASGIKELIRALKKNPDSIFGVFGSCILLALFSGAGLLHPVFIPFSLLLNTILWLVFVIVIGRKFYLGWEKEICATGLGENE